MSLTVLNPSRSPKHSATVRPVRWEAGQGLLHPVVEEGPVGQAGQLVVEGQVPEIGLEGLALAQ